MISFIIPAHNEEAHLPGTLAAVRGVIAELGLEAEIVVADDASTDRTPEIARAFAASAAPIPVVLVRHERRQISATRNLGYRASKGAMCVFVDADTLVNAPVVRAAIELMDGGAVGGGCLMNFEGRVPMHARMLAGCFLVWMRLCNFCGAAFLFARREALERVAAASEMESQRTAGPWDESVFAGEEIVLAKALKKVGRFRLTPSRTRATTSGRKLRTYSLAEMLGFFWRASIGGRRFLKDRANLGLWYDERRRDPG